MYLTPTRPAMAARAWASSLHSACLARLPTELWGAVNAVRRAIVPTTPPKPTQRTLAALAAEAPTSFPGPRPDLVVLLDTQPALTLLEV